MRAGNLFRSSWRDLRASRRQDAAYKRIWSAFSHYPEIADGRHDTEHWQEKPGPFAICLIRVPAAALEPSLSELHAALAGLPYVRAHPDHFLHITLQELGFVTDPPQHNDDVAPARLEEFLTGATAALAGAGPFEIGLGGANAFQDAVFLDIHDRGQCGRIHERLRELAALPTQPRFAYIPHCTVAHFTESRPTPPDLAARLERWRDRRFGALIVRELEVVTLEVEESYPQFQTLAFIPLTGDGMPSPSP
jgi:2'-5' RNA ligase